MKLRLQWLRTHCLSSLHMLPHQNVCKPTGAQQAQGSLAVRQLVLLEVMQPCCSQMGWQPWRTNGDQRLRPFGV